MAYNSTSSLPYNVLVERLITISKLKKGEKLSFAGSKMVQDPPKYFSLDFLGIARTILRKYNKDSCEKTVKELQQYYPAAFEMLNSMAKDSDLLIPFRGEKNLSDIENRVHLEVKNRITQLSQSLEQSITGVRNLQAEYPYEPAYDLMINDSETKVKEIKSLLTKIEAAYKNLTIDLPLSSSRLESKSPSSSETLSKSVEST